MCGQKPAGFRVSTFIRYAIRTSVGGPRQGGMDGGSRPALPGLHDVLWRSRSLGSFGLRVAVVEPLGFRV